MRFGGYVGTREEGGGGSTLPAAERRKLIPASCHVLAHRARPSWLSPSLGQGAQAYKGRVEAGR